MPENQRYYVNFDGLIGPSHNFAGLASGNLASAQSAHHTAHPRDAALQGLEKMRQLQQLGLPQGIIPPLPRPDLNFLSRVGFQGSDQAKIQQASHCQTLLMSVFSASNMWVANAATVSSSRHSQQAKVQLTPANLCSQLHRSIETPLTQALLLQIFDNSDFFTHHPPLPSQWQLADEGAANVMTLETEQRHISIFVYGRDDNYRKSSKGDFEPRQSKLASQSVARLHQLKSSETLFVKQRDDAIQAGVFHNDVIAVSQGNTLFYHQEAFVDSQHVMAQIRQFFAPEKVHLIAVDSSEVSLKHAVASYLFNSQLVPLEDGSKALICPLQCQQTQCVNQYLARLIQAKDNPISKVIFVDLLQSMKNGGGPACLRLSLQLTQAEMASIKPVFWLTDERYHALTKLIQDCYPVQIRPQDLTEASLLRQLKVAYSAIGNAFNLAPFYQNMFQ